MAQYRFTQSYTTNVSVGGIVGIRSRTFNAGEIVNGVDEGGDTIKVSLGTSEVVIQGASPFVNIPKSVLELYVPSVNDDLLDPQVVVGQIPNQTSTNCVKPVGYDLDLLRLRPASKAYDQCLATQGTMLPPLPPDGASQMAMVQGQTARKKIFSQNIRENVKNALSNLRERVGKVREEVERDFERTKAKIKESFDKRNKRKPDNSGGYYDLALESIDVNSFEPANYPNLRKKRVPHFVTHAINLVRSLGLDATIEMLERQATTPYENRSGNPIVEGIKTDYARLKQDVANALKQLKSVAEASGTTNEVAIEIPSGMENVVITEQSIPRTANSDEAISFDGRMRRGRNGLSGFANASGC